MKTVIISALTVLSIIIVTKIAKPFYDRAILAMMRRKYRRSSRPENIQKQIQEELAKEIQEYLQALAATNKSKKNEKITHSSFDPEISADTKRLLAKIAEINTAAERRRGSRQHKNSDFYYDHRDVNRWFWPRGK